MVVYQPTWKRLHYREWFTNNYAAYYRFLIIMQVLIGE